MPVFQYRGRNPRGELVQGQLEGADTGAIADQLLNTGVTPVDIRGGGARIAVEGLTPEWLRRMFTPRVATIDVMMFSRQIYTLLRAGVPILRALASLQESSTNPTLTEVIQDLRESLDSGRELSVALRRHPKVFSAFYVSLVRVGEMTGHLDDVFLRLFHYLEFEKDMRDRIRAALRYPSFVIIAMVLAIALINIIVIPVFKRVFEGFGAKLPGVTQILIAGSDLTVAYWPLMVAMVGVVAVGFRFWTGTESGRYLWDKYKLRLPIAGELILKGTLSRFARSFSLAVKSGVPMVQGLAIVSDVVDNAYIGQRIDQMLEGVERGESITRTAAAAGIFTPVVMQMIAVGDETGEIDDLMLEVAEMYDREVDYQVKNLAAQIEPILIVFLGILVTILALGVFLPIWDLGRVALRR
jgi:MSHA biogenesis protein MshG